MTTRILIVNHGPKSVKVSTTQNLPEMLSPGNEISKFVYEGQEVQISEIKEEEKTQ